MSIVPNRVFAPGCNKALASAAFAAMLAAPVVTPVVAQSGAATRPDSTSDQIRTMVSRLDLEQYKANVKGLTQFGDRRQGTARNRAAVDWIEAQLKSYGCTPTERITYDFQPPPPRPPLTPEQLAQMRARAATNTQGPGGSHMRGKINPTGVNTDSMLQRDLALRALDTPQSVAGERQEVYCTKVGTAHPDEMYIVGGHMDGIGWGEAANDDGSGTALVMQLARV
ncbi:MAG: M28 family metallopeptidase, partial [Gemmatimonadota bacterium]|nr:M28 family metallopeptidase [Gemmatimonadota bacterium]